MKKIRYFIEYIFLLGLGYVIRMIPRRVVLWLGARVGDLIYYCIPIRKKLTIEQLARSFPEKSRKEIAGIARGAYQNLGINGLEHLSLPGLSKKELIDIVTLENEEAMRRAYARKKGIVFVGGHFGNWEYPSSAVASRGYPVSIIVADLGNPFLDRMVNAHRMKAGVTILTKGMSVRGILKTLRNNEFIGMLMDQDAGAAGIFTDYFGKSCSTPRGPAIFALKTGATVIFMSPVRQQDGSIKVIFEEVDVDYAKGATEENILDITQRCTSRLEFYTRKYPDQWFWMHRRWKTRPHQVTSK